MARSGEVPMAVVEVEGDAFQDVTSEAVAALALDMGNTQTVAASWLEDLAFQSVEHHSLRVDTDAFLMNATMAITGGS